MKPLQHAACYRPAQRRMRLTCRQCSLRGRSFLSLLVISTMLSGPSWAGSRASSRLGSDTLSSSSRTFSPATYCCRTDSETRAASWRPFSPPVLVLRGPQGVKHTYLQLRHKLGQRGSGQRRCSQLLQEPAQMCPGLAAPILGVQLDHRAEKKMGCQLVEEGLGNGGLAHSICKPCHHVTVYG